MNVTEEDVLYSVSDLSDEHQEVFSDGFQYFNWIQSECFPQLYRADGNMVIGSPTGSGKTVLMELAMLRVLQKRGNQPGSSLKIVYLAPTHALVNEKHLDWQQRFGKLGLSALALTRADVLDMQKEIKGADIILTTPEKFDAITRKRKNLLMSFFADIALVLIDEVHILNEERGASLEAIVSRLKLVSQIPEMQMYNLPISQIRYIAVSATVPNIADIGQWLHCSQEGIKSYGDEMRPVKLLTAVLGYQPCKNNFMFEKNLNRYVYDGKHKPPFSWSLGQATIALTGLPCLADSFSFSHHEVWQGEIRHSLLLLKAGLCKLRSRHQREGQPPVPLRSSPGGFPLPGSPKIGGRESEGPGSQRNRVSPHCVVLQ